jgi:hypothetical protein
VAAASKSCSLPARAVAEIIANPVTSIAATVVSVIIFNVFIGPNLSQTDAIEGHRSFRRKTGATYVPGQFQAHNP